MYLDIDRSGNPHYYTNESKPQQEDIVDRGYCMNYNIMIRILNTDKCTKSPRREEKSCS